jgi:hypothetical protein
MSSTVRNRKERVNPENEEKGTERECPGLLARFNSPELLKRRSAAIAQANAVHTKKSDDALELLYLVIDGVVSLLPW